MKTTKTTIEELKKAKNFTVEQWYGVTYETNGVRTTRSGGYKSDDYQFTYNPNNKCLYVSGGVFGNKQYQVLNVLEVLFGIAQGYRQITVKVKGLSFDIINLILRLDNK